MLLAEGTDWHGIALVIIAVANGIAIIISAVNSILLKRTKKDLAENTELTKQVKQEANGITDKMVEAARLTALVAIEAKRKADEEGK